MTDPRTPQPAQRPSDLRVSRGRSDVDEEGLQLGEDHVLDVVPKAPQRLKHGSARRWPFWVESYVEGRVEVHLHYRVRASDHRLHEVEKCAIFERANLDIGVAPTQVDPPQVSDGDPGNLTYGPGDVAVSVEVDPTQLVYQGERMLSRICSVVRLQGLDNCPRSPFDPTELPRATSGVRLGLGEDGKLGLAGSLTTGASQAVGQTVEARPQSSDYIANRLGEGRGRLAIDVTADDEVQVALREQRMWLYLSDCSVGLRREEALDLPLNLLEMLVCSVEPAPPRRGHPADSRATNSRPGASS